MTAPYEPPPPPKSGMTPAQLAELLALVQAQAAVRQHLTRAAVTAAVAAFDGFTDWWNPVAVKKAIAAALKVVVPSQKQAATLTDAYLTRAARLMTGKPVRPGGVVDVSKLRRAIPEPLARQLIDGTRRPPYIILGDTHDGPGLHINQPAPLAVRDDTAHVSWVHPAEPYGRVAYQYRYGVVAQGVPEEQAQAKAILRVGVVAESDITAAVREQYRKTMGAQKAEGYRRILHPELSQTGPCGLCVVAADRIYRRGDLMPLHSRCCCEVLPVYAGMDPGISLNWKDLDMLYQAAGGTSGGRRGHGGLKKLRVALAENGETGPVLVDADQHHRGPVEVARTQIPDRGIRAAAQLASLEKSFETLKLRAMAGEHVDKPLQWQGNRIAELRRELATAS